MQFSRDAAALEKKYKINIIWDKSELMQLQARIYLFRAKYDTYFVQIMTRALVK